jgi:hypothetical protein
MAEEYAAFSGNTSRREIQSTIPKVHTTANLLKGAIVDEQLRHQIDQARDLPQRLGTRNSG